MPLSSALVGRRAAPWIGRVDARWLMAYAAGLGRGDDAYLNTTRTGGVVGHPMFPVCPEWALLVAPESKLDLGLEPHEGPRAVHASHDLVLYRPVRADIDVVVTAAVAGVEATPPGALLTIRFDGSDDDGTPLWTTWMRSLYRGVDVVGETVTPSETPDPVTLDRPGNDATPLVVPLAREAAHIYTECARIWNPIHTDRSVAMGAGLDDIIFHGTATLAHGVSCALDHIGRDPESVRRLGGSFRAMVALPAELTVRVGPLCDDAVAFEVITASGTAAVQDGYVIVS